MFARKGFGMGKRGVLALVMILGCSLTATAAGFPETYGIGNRAIALGNAFTAVADDATAVYYNPAGLSQTRNHEVTLQYFYTSPQLEVKRLDNGQDLKILNANGQVRTNPNEAAYGKDLDLPLPMVAAKLDINRIVPALPTNVQFGLIMAMPENFDTDYRLSDYPPDQPHFFRYGDDIDHLEMQMALGVEVVKDLLHVGAGVQSILMGPSTFYVDDMVDSLDAPTGDVVSQCRIGLSWDFWPTAGILFTPLDKRLKLGLSWTKDYQTTFDVPIYAQFDAGGGLYVDAPLFLDIQTYYTPEIIRGGLAWDSEKFLVSVDVWQEKWSDYDYSDTDKVNFYAGNPAIIAPVAEKGSPDFDDTVNFGIGFEYKGIKDLSLMLGYSHIPTPIPDQTNRVTNYLDADRDIFSLGCSYTVHPKILVPPLTISGTFQYHNFEDYKVYKNGVSGLSAWDGATGSTAQTSYKVEGDIFAAGLGVTMKW